MTLRNPLPLLESPENLSVGKESWETAGSNERLGLFLELTGQNQQIQWRRCGTSGDTEWEGLFQRLWRCIFRVPGEFEKLKVSF